MNEVIKIKNFGNDREFINVEELIRVLSDEYRGKHVSIVFSTKPFGLKKTVFISIDNRGLINLSYGNQKPLYASDITDVIEGVHREENYV